MIVDEVNRNGGIGGRKVELISYDNECSPEKGASTVERLISRDKVLLIRGGVCSGASLAMLPIVEREEVPMVIGSSTSMKIKEIIGIGGNEWGFRANIDDEHKAMALSYVLVKEMGLKKFVGLFPNNDWGRVGGETFKKWIPRRGGQLVLAEYYDPEAQDFMAYLTKYKRMNLDGMIIIGTPRQGAPIVRQAHSIDLNIQKAGLGGVEQSKTVELAGKEALEGLIGANGWSTAVQNPLNQQYVKRFNELYGEDPIAGKTYFSMQIAIDAIRRAIKEVGEPTTKAIKEALETTDIETIIGRVRFNLHHQGMQDIFVTQIRDGKIKLIKTVKAKNLAK